MMYFMSFIFLASLGVWVRSILVKSFSSWDFPIGVLVANAIGCFLIGAFYHYQRQSGLSSNEGLFGIWVYLVPLACLGALTTYSSYSLDVIKLVEAGKLGLAGINILANNVLGIGFCYLGLRIAQVFWNKV